MNISNVREKLSDGVYLNIINTDKFKSNLISFNIVRPLCREEVTKNALIPLVLKRGTKNYNTTLQIERKLEEFYGSNLSAGVSKKGEKQVIRFTIEGIDDKYVNINNLFKENLSMLNEILFNPIVENDSFLEKYVNTEKKNLKERIESRINNKKQYAVDRCIEEMCTDETFRLYQYGYVEDLNSITNKNLYEHYLNVLKSSRIEISVIGNLDKNVVIKDINEIFTFVRSDIVDIPKEIYKKEITKENIVHDKMDINQGKLTLGFRTNIPYDSDLYEAFLIGSNILGGGPESKLFLNVREKHSLAYYIYTKTYKDKSIMLIASGIEFDKYEKTLEIINQEIENIKNGNFEHKDIEISKKSLITSIKTLTDENYSLSEFYFSQVISDDKRTLEDIIQKIDNVKKEDIINAINLLKLDTVYFLKNN